MRVHMLASRVHFPADDSHVYDPSRRVQPSYNPRHIHEPYIREYFQRSEDLAGQNERYESFELVGSLSIPWAT